LIISGLRWHAKPAHSLLRQPRDYGIAVFSEFSDDEVVHMG